MGSLPYLEEEFVDDSGDWVFCALGTQAGRRRPVKAFGATVPQPAALTYELPP